MRLDDHRLHMAAINHVRMGVENADGNYQKVMEYVDAQDKAVYAEIDSKLANIAGKVDEAVPVLVEAKLTSIKDALETLRSTEAEMKAYINELEKARPEEGKLVFNTFQELKQEVVVLKNIQQQQAAATAAGIGSLAAT